MVKTSKSWSFDYWKVWEFVKGRKRMAVTVLGTVLGWFLTGDGTAALIAGGVIEAVWSVASYYFTTVKVK